ncbi:MAG: SpoIIE family protein phosphatase [Lachnospiraceae bacterium]|nr:SpoIIE family protein phosphatase [Lachnospiraceae bacterium]
MIKNGIRKKVIIYLIVFASVIVLLTSILTGLRYWHIKVAEYNDLVYDYLHTASELIDGEKVKEYIQTETPDEYYDNILNYLTVTRDNTAMQLFYVFVPYEDDLVYIWQTDGDPYSWLGKHEKYMDGGKETRDVTFNKNPEEKITFYNDPTYGDIACGFYPVYDNSGEPVALIGLDLSAPGIRNNIIAFIATIALIIFLGTLIAAKLYYSSLSKNIVGPIHHLNDAAKRITSNLERDETPDLNIHTGDELEELSSSFMKMYNDIRQYIKENEAMSAEKGRLEAELNVATQIQADMLPSVFPLFPEHKEFDLYASMDPAKEVGGDFFDSFFIDATHLALIIADVAGKGIPASLFMARALTAFKTRAMQGGSPSQIVSDVNNYMCERNDECLFVTVWFAIIDTTTWKGSATNAGHEYPILRRAGGAYELIKYEHSMPVGIMEDSIFEEHTFELHPGDSLFVYTDGVAEATGTNDELFGTDRLINSLNEDPEAKPENTLKNVISGINHFVAGAEQFDDITMLCIKYNGVKN